MISMAAGSLNMVTGKAWSGLPWLAWLLLGLVVLAIALLDRDARTWAAGSLYTYQEEDGTVVITDRLEKVPSRYRNRVSELETGGSSKPRVDAESERGWDLSGRVADVLASEEPTGEGFWSWLSGWKISGLSRNQSVLLVVGGILAILAYATMTLTRNPGLRFAMRWVLIFVLGGTVYGVYIGEVGTNLTPDVRQPQTEPTTVLDRVRDKADKIERLQQERVEGLE